jgi:hypothetical protein
MLNYTEQEFETLLRKNPVLRINQKHSMPGKRQPRGGGRIRSVMPDENPKEEVEQAELAKFLDSLGLDWFHVPNELMAKPQYIAKRARLGVKKGVLDNFIFDPPPAFPDAKGAVIELKRRKGGKVSDEQADWLIRLSKLGWRTAVCNGYNEAVKQLILWGYMKEWQ